ncbi:GspE/PulE family protein [Tichowtungia aerotolerans]|uniref:Secretion system protein E n=1 Tax=Tichowtungia aerotolerans TaxID=2697043 RepID=A0A6P1M7Z7_9BACT|nr:ATPase, T2SS/T4P/T4SS family [Tichowtungia aerotolerans]QHI70839.1 secretion system protein E [Tichowtungia aerotolerans]
MAENTYRTLMEILLDRCPVPEDLLTDARAESQKSGAAIEDVLVNQGAVPANDMLLAKAEYLEMTPISLNNFQLDNTLIELLPRPVWVQQKMLPLCKVGKLLTVAVADPFNLMGIEKLKTQIDYQIFPVIADEKDLMGTLEDSSKDSSVALEDILRDIEDDSDLEVGVDETSHENLDEMLEGAEDAPVVRIVNSILIEALRKHASDIHIEPMEKKIRLRYRIDGVLYESPSPPKSVQSAISSRIKIMSNLDIAERRIPQDGRFKIKALNKEVDIRVSYLPTVFGEKIVMRILDKSALSPSLEALSLEPKALEDLKFAIGKPHGMLLVTGPTGSGKTTTLYSALQELNKEDVNIITVEDPVEYQLAGINQVQTRPEVGLTFAAGLRSILRQDPDIVMIGEIRDNETASIAVQAALTGHLVLSTLHTNDAAGAIARMAYMGIEPFLLSSSLVMTQAQRLYRKLCPFCKKAIALPEDILTRNHLDPDRFRDIEFFEAKGCPKCGGLGYKGRGGIMEILLLDDALKAKILETAEASALREVAVANGMKTLREAGLEKVRKGETTVDEIMRVTSE